MYMQYGFLYLILTRPKLTVRRPFGTLSLRGKPNKQTLLDKQLFLNKCGVNYINELKNRFYYI